MSAFDYAFDRECRRKEKLLELFEGLETLERESKKKMKLKYEHIFHDWAVVVGVNDNTLAVETESGQSVAPIMINQDISRLIRCGDNLFFKAGHHNGKWHVIFIQSIGSSMSAGSN